MATSGKEQGNRLMEVVATEGRELEEVFGRIEAEATEPEERRRLADQLLQRLVVHADARREVLYPRVSQDVPDGDSLVDLALLGLAQIERTSKEIAVLSGMESTFHPLVTKLATEVWDHLDKEEGEVLPVLVDAIGVDAANHLGDALARAGAAGCGSSSTGPSVGAASRVASTGHLAGDFHRRLCHGQCCDQTHRSRHDRRRAAVARSTRYGPLRRSCG